MSDTPRTERAATYCGEVIRADSGDPYLAWYGFMTEECAKMERELSAEKVQTQRLREAVAAARNVELGMVNDEFPEIGSTLAPPAVESSRNPLQLEPSSDPCQLGETVSCKECLGDGFVEIQSGPYTRKCKMCEGTGRIIKENKPSIVEQPVSDTDELI